MNMAWKLKAEEALLEPDSQYVLSTAALMGLARAQGQTPSDATLHRWVKGLVAGRKLVPVSKGLYLNRLGHRSQDAAEAAQWLRRGSVLSLSWVLERAGVLNNIGSTYTCIIPLEPSLSQPQTTRKEIPGIGTFRFHAMKADLVDEAAGKAEDVFDPRFNYRRATPEKALLDWIYLGHSHRSRLAPPPLDMDVTALKKQRLDRLARRMGVVGIYEDWLAQWRAYQDDAAVLANGGGLF